MARLGTRVTSGVSMSGYGGASVVGRVSILGVPQAIAKLRAVGVAATRGLGMTTYNAARAMQAMAKSLVPVDSGHLQGGIQIGKAGLYDFFVSASSVDGGADHEYAGYVEYGTSKMSARPFMRPAREAAVKQATLSLRALGAALQRI